MIYKIYNVLLGLTVSTILTTPVEAGTFTPPEGCTAWLTVQMRSCRVSNHYTCQADTPGDKWRIDYGLNGAYFRSRIDYETQWVESHSGDGTIEFLEPNPADPASFTELVETGRDTFEFSQMSNTGVRENIKGYDQLTGESVVIDGVTLLRTKYDVEISNDDGSVMYRTRGSEYIHPEWRIFLSGTGQTDSGDGFVPRDFTPVDFIFPDENNFGTTIPIYDCGSVTAQSRPLIPASYRSPVSE